MAAYTAVSSGDWATAATWGGSVPSLANGDTITINTDVDVTLNSDISAAVLGNVTINGSLELASTASAKIALSGQLLGTGTLKAGSSDTPLPLSRTAQVIFSGAGYINSTNLNLQLYCYQPTNPVLTLAANWNGAASTWLNCDVGAADLDGWKISGLTSQMYVNKAIWTTDLATTTQIVGIAEVDGSDAADIQVDGATYATRSIGDKVVLVTRNVRIDGTTGTADDLIGCSPLSVINAEIRPQNAGRGISASFTEMGGTISGCEYGLRFSSGSISGTISGCNYGLYYSSGSVSGSISGCNYGLIYSSGTISGTISGCDYGLIYSSGTISGTISGCEYGLRFSSGSVSGSISGCNYGLYYSSGSVSGSISGCNYGLYYSTIIGYGNTHNNAIEYAGKHWGSQCIMCENSILDTAVRGFWGSCYDGNGEIRSSRTEPLPSGFTYYQTLTNGSLALPCFMQRQYVLKPGEKITAKGYMKLTGTHTGGVKLYIASAGSDSLEGGTDLGTTNISSLTSTEWQAISVSYTNTTSEPMLIYVRAQHEKASAVVNAAFTLSTSGGSNGWSSGSSSSGLFRPSRRF